jgi:DNA-binding NarL/FixJ family response regulator
MKFSKEEYVARVGIVHKDDIVACGLRATIRTQSDMEVHEGEVARDLSSPCTVVVCDFESGIALAQSAREAAGNRSASAPRILIFTSSIGVQGIRHALSLGVQGYMLADAALEDIVRGLRAVATGHRYLSPAVADRIADSLAYTPLTPRETDVLAWLGTGQCNKVIARQLGISVPTVKAHVTALMEKMNAGNRTQVVSKAVQRGLLQEHHFA